MSQTKYRRITPTFAAQFNGSNHAEIMKFCDDWDVPAKWERTSLYVDLSSRQSGAWNRVGDGWWIVIDGSERDLKSGPQFEDAYEESA